MVYDTTSLTQTHEYAEIPDNYDCIVAPDGRAFYVSDTTGVIHKIDIDSLEPVAPEPGSCMSLELDGDDDWVWVPASAETSGTYVSVCTASTERCVWV